MTAISSLSSSSSSSTINCNNNGNVVGDAQKELRCIVDKIKTIFKTMTDEFSKKSKLLKKDEFPEKSYSMAINNILEFSSFCKDVLSIIASRLPRSTKVSLEDDIIREMSLDDSKSVLEQIGQVKTHGFSVILANAVKYGNKELFDIVMKYKRKWTTYDFFAALKKAVQKKDEEQVKQILTLIDTVQKKSLNAPADDIDDYGLFIHLATRWFDEAYTIAVKTNQSILTLLLNNDTLCSCRCFKRVLSSALITAIEEKNETIISLILTTVSNKNHLNKFLDAYLLDDVLKAAIKNQLTNVVFLLINLKDSSKNSIWSPEKLKYRLVDAVETKHTEIIDSLLNAFTKYNAEGEVVSSQPWRDEDLSPALEAAIQTQQIGVFKTISGKVQKWHDSSLAFPLVAAIKNEDVDLIDFILNLTTSWSSKKLERALITSVEKGKIPLIERIMDLIKKDEHTGNATFCGGIYYGNFLETLLCTAIKSKNKEVFDLIFVKFASNNQEKLWNNVDIVSKQSPLSAALVVAAEEGTDEILSDLASFAVTTLELFPFEDKKDQKDGLWLKIEDALWKKIEDAVDPTKKRLQQEKRLKLGRKIFDQCREASNAREAEKARLARKRS